jgi:hypothetical protein
MTEHLTDHRTLLIRYRWPITPVGIFISLKGKIESYEESLSPLLASTRTTEVSIWRSGYAPVFLEQPFLLLAIVLILLSRVARPSSLGQEFSSSYPSVRCFETVKVTHQQQPGKAIHHTFPCFNTNLRS